MNENIGKIKETVTTFLRRHRFVVMALVAFLVMMVVGNIMKGGVRSAVAEKERELATIRNGIDAANVEGEKVVEVVNDLTHGLSTKRWKNDDDLMTAWITPAFTWSNLTEYNQNREFYVERLGADDPFLTGFMIPREAQYGFQTDYNKDVDLGEDINMAISTFKSYVVAIDEQTGTYSYLALVQTYSIDYNSAVGNSSENHVLTYDITSTGEVENFKHCTAHV